MLPTNHVGINLPDSVGNTVHVPLSINRDPHVGDLGVTISGVFFPILEYFGNYLLTTSQSEKLGLNVSVPVVTGKTKTLQVETPEVVPMTSLDTGFYVAVAANSSYGVSQYDILSEADLKTKLGSLWKQRITYAGLIGESTNDWIQVRPLHFVSDVPTEESADFVDGDQNLSGYSESIGVSFDTVTHDEYDEDSVDYTQGVGYIYTYNDDSAPTVNQIADVVYYSGLYTQALVTMQDAYAKYTAGYSPQANIVANERATAAQAAYDATRTAINEAEANLTSVQNQRNTAAQSAYDTEAATWNDQISASQAAESEAATLYYATENTAYSSAEAAYNTAYNQAIADGKTESEAWDLAYAAWTSTYNSFATDINDAYTAWMTASQNTANLQSQQQTAAQSAYDTEYATWADDVADAQSAYDSAVSSWDSAAAQAAYDNVYNSYEEEYNAALEYDASIPNMKVADYRDWQSKFRLASVAYRKKLLAEKAGVDFGPHPAMRVPQNSPAPIDPPTPVAQWGFSTDPTVTGAFTGAEPSFPFPQVGTVWDGKHFTPAHRPLGTVTGTKNYPCRLRFRAFRKGRLLSDVNDFYYIRYPGKIIVSFDSSSRQLRVESPFSPYVKFSATYADGSSLFTAQTSPAMGIVNQNSTITISVSTPMCGAVPSLSVALVVIGTEEEKTATFSTVFWTPQFEKRGVTRTTAVVVALDSGTARYFVAAGANGNGLSPDTPGSWDTVYNYGNGAVVFVSGDPTTANSYFMCRSNSRYIGGFNSTFTKITGKSLLTKPLSNPSYSLFENFKATTYGIFTGGSLIRCEMTFDGTINSGVYFVQASAMRDCDITIVNNIPRTLSNGYWSDTANGFVYCPYITRCRIRGTGIKGVYCTEVFDSSIILDGADYLMVGFNYYGYVTNIQEGYLPVGVVTPANSYEGEKTRVVRSTVQLTCNEGVDGVAGTSDTYVGGDGTTAWGILEFMEAMESTLSVNIPDRGNGGQGLSGSTYNARGGYGGSAYFSLPAYCRKCSIDVYVGEPGTGGPAGVGTTPYTESWGCPDWWSQINMGQHGLKGYTIRWAPFLYNLEGTTFIETAEPVSLSNSYEDVLVGSVANTTIRPMTGMYQDVNNNWVYVYGTPYLLHTTDSDSFVPSYSGANLVRANGWGSTGEDGLPGHGTWPNTDVPYYTTFGCGFPGQNGGNALPAIGVSTPGQGGNGGTGYTRPAICAGYQQSTQSVIYTSYPAGVAGLSGNGGIVLGDFLE